MPDAPNSGSSAVTRAVPRRTSARFAVACLASSRLASSRGATTVRALALSCHPAPTVAVTGFAAILAALAGNRAGTIALVAAAVVTGQLSIGWSNDLIDAARDAASGRTDKPVASGTLDRRLLKLALVPAVLATIAISLTLGVRAGLLHLAAVACGWAYNLGLKRTWLSWLPYAVAFGALPGVATLARHPPAAPAPWIVAAGALLGTIANLTNVLPDLDADERTGVRGAPHRLGARRCVALSSILLLAATVTIAVGPRGSTGVAGYTGIGLAVLLAGAGCSWALNHPRARATFYGLFAFVALQLVLVAITSHHLR